MRYQFLRILLFSWLLLAMPTGIILGCGGKWQGIENTAKQESSKTEVESLVALSAKKHRHSKKVGFGPAEKTYNHRHFKPKAIRPCAHYVHTKHRKHVWVMQFLI